MDDVRTKICMRLMEGESLRSICESEDMPCKATVFNWLASDEAFREQYQAARLIQADTLADEILDISDDARNDWMEKRREDGTTVRCIDNEHVQRSRLRVDSRKWLASKMAPKKYGDATLLKHGNPDGDPLPAMTNAEKAIRLASIAREVLERAGDDA